MLKAIGFVIKLCIFSVFTLVIGNWITWNGETLSERVQTQVSRMEGSDMADHVRGWTRKLTDDARSGFGKKLGLGNGHNVSTAPSSSSSSKRITAAAKNDEVTDRTETASAAPTHSRSDEKMPSSERQKLRALIRELNSSHGKD